MYSGTRAGVVFKRSTDLWPGSDYCFVSMVRLPIMICMQVVVCQTEHRSVAWQLVLVNMHCLFAFHGLYAVLCLLTDWSILSPEFGKRQE